MNEPMLQLETITKVYNAGKPAEVVSVSQQGEAYFATRAGDGTVYALDGKVVEELHQLAASAKPLP